MLSGVFLQTPQYFKNTVAKWQHHWGAWSTIPSDKCKKYLIGAPACCGMSASCQTLVQVSATFEKNGQALPHTVSGKWDHSLDAHMPDGTKQHIWTIHSPPPDPTR